EAGREGQASVARCACAAGAGRVEDHARESAAGGALAARAAIRAGEPPARGRATDHFRPAGARGSAAETGGVRTSRRRARKGPTRDEDDLPRPLPGGPAGVVPDERRAGEIR